MNDIKRIMTALGFSKYCPQIFAFAANLALALEAELTVANVINIRDVEAVNSIESMGYQVNRDDYLKGIQEERQAQLDALVAKNRYPQDKLKTIFRVGHPFDQLMKIVKDEDIDLVVMGAKGRSDLERVLIGSVAEKMIRHSPVPVVSFRAQAGC